MLERIVTDQKTFFGAAYNSLGWKGKAATLAFLVLLPIFLFGKLILGPAMLPKRLAHCEAVVAGQKAKAFIDEKEFCADFIKKNKKVSK